MIHVHSRLHQTFVNIERVPKSVDRLSEGSVQKQGSWMASLLSFKRGDLDYKEILESVNTVS